MIPKPVILDISEWQVPSKIDYDKLAKAIDGVIVRVQYGSKRIDKHYQTHIREFQKRNIPVAVYAWVRGVSVADMEQEAKDFYARAKAFDPVFWWLDVEERSMADMRSGCEAFRKKLKQLGAKNVGAYIANHLYATFRLDTAKFDGIWLPTYGKNNGKYTGSKPTATSHYHLHQYTSAGRLPGYGGNLDLNRLVQGTLAFFFGKEIKKEATKTTKSSRFRLTTTVHLRKAPTTSAASLTLLKAGAEVEIQQLQVAEAYLWGEQLRADGSRAYLALGALKGYGRFV